MKPKYSLTEVSQEIDLSEVLNRTPSEVEAREFIDRAINLIIERTQSGVDINGRQFKEYSKDYAEFKGTSRGDVDLTLTSAMLSSISGESEGAKIKLFIPSDQTEKAYNHNVGDTLPRRTFFGLTEKEISEISEGIGIASAFESVNQVNISELLRNIGFAIDES